MNDPRLVSLIAAPTGEAMQQELLELVQPLDADLRLLHLAATGYRASVADDTSIRTAIERLNRACDLSSRLCRPDLQSMPDMLRTTEKLAFKIAETDFVAPLLGGLVRDENNNHLLALVVGCNMVISRAISVLKLMQAAITELGSRSSPLPAH